MGLYYTLQVIIGGYHLSADQGIRALAEAGPLPSAERWKAALADRASAGGPLLSIPGDAGRHLVAGE